ncbi:MAG: hypothetical protein RLZZ293_1356 [Pseudomonadota bacterium]|jgi:hypothetical protein
MFKIWLNNLLQLVKLNLISLTTQINLFNKQLTIS